MHEKNTRQNGDVGEGVGGCAAHALTYNSLLGGLVLLSLLLTSCSGLQSLLPRQDRGEMIFLPPTSASPTRRVEAPGQFSGSAQDRASSEKGFSGETSAPVPTSTPICTNNLTFMEDLTIPDGSLFPPGESMDKRWLVENSGTCNWEAGYRLKLVAGQDLGSPSEQALYPARSGTQATIHISFTAPSDPGTYRSAWQAHDPSGNPFGDPFFIEIAVEPPAITAPE